MTTNTNQPEAEPLVKPRDHNGYQIAQLLKGLGIRSRADLARFDKSRGVLGISGIGAKRLSLLRTATKSAEAWAYLFGTLLPWETPIKESAADVVYHVCGTGVERWRNIGGKYNEIYSIHYYPLNASGKPYDIPVDAIVHCPGCRGWLHEEDMDVVLPPPSGEPVSPPEPTQPDAEIPAGDPSA